MLFFIRDTVILGSNGSIPKNYRDQGAVGYQEGLHLITYGDNPTSYFVFRVNIVLACLTNLVQPELLVGNATEIQFGDCVLF